MNESFRSELISWATVQNLSRKLTAKIRDSGFDPDLIVAVASAVTFLPGSCARLS